MNSFVFNKVNVLKENMPLIQKEFQVKKIGFFGSVLGSQFGSDSDIDILVEFDKPISLLKFVRLSNQLEKILGRRVDLVMKKSLKKVVADEIQSSVLYV